MASESSLFIYIDGSKINANAETIANIEEVKKVAEEKKWCGEVTIIAAEKIKGCLNQ
jgi:hypothetical protein